MMQDTSIYMNKLQGKVFVESFIIRISEICLLIAISASLVFLAGCSNPDQEYKAVFKSDNIQVYQDIIKKYPNHPRANEAKSRIADLQWMAAGDSESI